MAAVEISVLRVSVLCPRLPSPNNLCVEFFIYFGFVPEESGYKGQCLQIVQFRRIFSVLAYKTRTVVEVGGEWNWWKNPTFLGIIKDIEKLFWFDKCSGGCTNIYLTRYNFKVFVLYLSISISGYFYSTIQREILDGWFRFWHKTRWLGKVHGWG